MLSASVASQIVLTSILKQMAGGRVSVLIEGEIKMAKKVYVQPGIIYLAIGDKTSSVRNIIVYGTWLVYETGKILYGRLRVFRRGKKFQGFISFGHHHIHTHSWLSLTARSLAPAEGGGVVWLVHSSLHTTEGVLHFPFLTTREKKLRIPQ